jgi:predicted transcriptional regulator
VDAENVLASRLRIKIVKMLITAGELNVSELVRKLGANFTIVSGHLKVLENEGILQRKMFGRVRLYRINEQSAKARALLSLLEVWEKPA